MRVCLIASLALLGLEATAAEIQVGQQYPAGAKVESPADGVSFVIPEEWLGGLPPGAAAFILGSHTRAGIGTIIMRASASWEQIEQFLNQPQDLGDGVVLTPTSSGQRTERGYEIGLAHPLYAGHAIGRLGEDGNGIIVFFGGPAEQRDYYVQLATRTADSVAFAAPRASPALDQWRSHLAGRMLKRMSSYYSGGSGDGSYIGSSSSQTLHLCSDASYAFFSNSSLAADGGGGVSGHSSGGGEDYGQWRVEIVGDRVLLTLYSRDAGVSQQVLTVQGEWTYLDGQRVYRVSSDRCR
jgi:hypothetical protein